MKTTNTMLTIPVKHLQDLGFTVKMDGDSLQEGTFIRNITIELTTTPQGERQVPVQIALDLREDLEKTLNDQELDQLSDATMIAANKEFIKLIINR